MAAAPAATDPLHGIVPAIKSLPTYKQTAANMTLTDANHDFREIIKKWWDIEANRAANRAAYNAGIPYAATGHISEPAAFFSILTPAFAATDAKEFLNAIEAAPQQFTAGLKGTANAALHSYSAQAVRIKEPSGADDDREDVATDGDKYSIFGKDFIEATNLNGAVLVVDFNQNGFLNMLKTGPSDASKAMYYAMTPEVINDPAGKTPVEAPLFKKAEGIQLIPIVQAGTSPVTFSAYDETVADAANDFFSALTFTLSPIQESKFLGRTRKYVNLRIEQGNQVESVSDSKLQNSIAELLKFMRKLLSQIGNPKSEFLLNSKTQQKRGGDWFQILCALLALYREYTVYPTGAPFKPTRAANPVYFVTHDFVAATFALLMGANVLFINQKRVFVFTNQRDARTDGPPPEESFRTYIAAQGALLASITAFLTNYTANRTAALSSIKGTLTANLTALDTLLAAAEPKAPAPLREQILRVLDSSMRLAFLLKELPDLQGYLTELAKPLPADASTPERREAIREFRTTFWAAYKVYTDKGSVPDFALPKNFYNALLKSEQYLSCRNWSYAKPLLSRLFGKRIGVPNNDPYAFLAYLQTLDDEEARTRVANTMTEVHRLLWNTAPSLFAAGTSDIYKKNFSDLLSQIIAHLAPEQNATMRTTHAKAKGVANSIISSQILTETVVNLHNPATKKGVTVVEYGAATEAMADNFASDENAAAGGGKRRTRKWGRGGRRGRRGATKRRVHRPSIVQRGGWSYETPLTDTHSITIADRSVLYPLIVANMDSLDELEAGEAGILLGGGSPASNAADAMLPLVLVIDALLNELTRPIQGSYEYKYIVFLTKLLYSMGVHGFLITGKERESGLFYRELFFTLPFSADGMAFWSRFGLSQGIPMYLCSLLGSTVGVPAESGTELITSLIQSAPEIPMAIWAYTRSHSKVSTATSVHDLRKMLLDTLHRIHNRVKSERKVRLVLAPLAGTKERRHAESAEEENVAALPATPNVKRRATGPVPPVGSDPRLTYALSRTPSANDPMTGVPSSP